jgi:hypothetical protein
VGYLQREPGFSSKFIVLQINTKVAAGLGKWVLPCGCASTTLSLREPCSYMLSNWFIVLFSHVGMQPENVRLRPKDSMLGGLDTRVSNTPTTLETVSDLCVMMYGLHVRMNDKCTCNIHTDILYQYNGWGP